MADIKGDVAGAAQKVASDAGQYAQGNKQSVRGDIAKTPLKAVLIAFAAGLVLGQLLALFGV